MNIIYNVKSYNEDAHQVLVSFRTDKLTFEDLGGEQRMTMAIDLPIPTPVGDELDVFIVARAPGAWLDRQEKIKAVKSEIGTLGSSNPDIVALVIGEPRSMSKEEFEAKLPKPINAVPIRQKRSAEEVVPTTAL